MKKAIILFLSVMLLCSCSAFSDADEENTGTIVTPEDIERVSEALSKNNIDYVNGVDTNAPIYYWSENGSVFHSRETCSALANSKKIIAGNINHAHNHGIEKTCSRCFG